jgi:hypothetical protein
MRLTFCVVIMLAACYLLLLTISVVGQQDGAGRRLVINGVDVYCMGFISEAAPRSNLRVVGAEKENLKDLFTQGDIIFLNKGRDSGVAPGAIYIILRPLGSLKHPFNQKKLGYHVRELGLARILDVQKKTATAEITHSCDAITYGDLLKPYEAYVAPEMRDGHPLPRHREGMSKVKGQIIMAQGFHEYLSTNQIVYIDLGSRQGVSRGASFIIYREIGRQEGLVKVRDDKVTQDRSSGFGSERFRGGDFSIDSSPISIEHVLRTRPPLPRKVLGELVVLKVEKNTSVALITRTNAEVNIGDFIERSN